MPKRGNQKVSEVFSHFFKCILDKYALSYNKNYAYTQTQETRHKGFFYEPFGTLPLTERIRLLLRNNAIKLKNRQNCCGHPGEPGC